MVNFREMLLRLCPKIKLQPSLSVSQIFMLEIKLLFIILNFILLIHSFYVNNENDLHQSTNDYSKITNSSIYSQYYEDNLPFYLNDGASNYYYRPSPTNNQPASNQNLSTLFKIGN